MTHKIEFYLPSENEGPEDKRACGMFFGTGTPSDFDDLDVMARDIVEFEVDPELYDDDIQIALLIDGKPVGEYVVTCEYTTTFSVSRVE